MMNRLAIIASMLCLGLIGCVQPSSVAGYAADRGRDLAEVFRLSVGAGVGLHARAGVPYLRVAEGFAWTHMVGWDGAAGIHDWHWNKLSASHWPLFPGFDEDVRALDPGARWSAFGRLIEGENRTCDFQAEYLFIRDLDPHAWEYKEVYYSRRPLSSGTRAADHYWIEVDLTALVPSVRVGVNPVELADFLAGLFCLDILHDDRFIIPPREQKKCP